MTSFGIEWDTSLLVYTKHGDESLIEKAPIVKGDKWAISFESYHAGKNRQTEAGILESDCTKSIEAQLGVFRSKKDDYFDTTELCKTLRIFQTYWKNIIEEKKINVKGGEYNVLKSVMGDYIENDIGNKIYFKDCSLTNLGTFNNKWVYTQDKLNNIRGVPQITIVIKVKYIIDNFLNKIFSIDIPTNNKFHFLKKNNLKK